MSKSLIYLIAIFCLWMYFSFSSSANGGTEKKENSRGTWKPSGGFGAGSGNGGTGRV